MAYWNKIQNQSVFYKKPRKKKKGKNFTGKSKEEIAEILASDAALRKLVRQEQKKIVPKADRPKPKFDNRRWKEVRYLALVKYGKKCMACNATDKPLHVDHILPKSKYPKLAYDFNNLQILCDECNLGKSNKDETDWR